MWKVMKGDIFIGVKPTKEEAEELQAKCNKFATILNSGLHTDGIYIIVKC